MAALLFAVGITRLMNLHRLALRIALYLDNQMLCGYKDAYIIGKESLINADAAGG